MATLLQSSQNRKGAVGSSSASAGATASAGAAGATQSSTQPKVVITILRAESIRGTQTFGKQDPYCVMVYGKRRVKTRVHENGGKNPEWNQRLRSLDLKSMSDKITFEIWNRNSMSDNVIGVAKAVVSQIPDGVPASLPVIHKNKQKGVLIIQAAFTNNQAMANAGSRVLNTALNAVSAFRRPSLQVASPSNPAAMPAAPASPFASGQQRSSGLSSGGTGVGFRQGYQPNNRGLTGFRAAASAVTTANRLAATAAPAAPGASFRVAASAVATANRFSSAATPVTAPGSVAPFRAAVGAVASANRFAAPLSVPASPHVVSGGTPYPPAPGQPVMAQTPYPPQAFAATAFGANPHQARSGFSQNAFSASAFGGVAPTAPVVATQARVTGFSNPSPQIDHVKIAQLSAIVGTAVPQAQLIQLLQSAGNDVNRAANHYFTGTQ